MKNVNSKKSATDLASLLLNEKANTFDQTSQGKVVVTDECGDTLWDDVLEQAEKNHLVNNKEIDQPVDSQGKINEQK